MQLHGRGWGEKIWAWGPTRVAQQLLTTTGRNGNKSSLVHLLSMRHYPSSCSVPDVTTNVQGRFVQTQQNSRPFPLTLFLTSRYILPKPNRPKLLDSHQHLPPTIPSHSHQFSLVDCSKVLAAASSQIPVTDAKYLTAGPASSSWRWLHSGLLLGLERVSGEPTGEWSRREKTILVWTR